MSGFRNRKPNVLLVVIDCLRADHCSTYGYDRPTTPTLDVLAEHSVVYSQAISAAGWSLPSHASIFTGLYPSRHGADDQHQFLSDDVPVLAELLQRVGYQTLGFCGNPWVSNATRLTRGFGVYDSLAAASSRRMSLVQRTARRVLRKAILLGSGGRIRRADWASMRTRRWIERLRTSDDPFFMFIHYNEPHTPDQLPLKDRMRFMDGVASDREVGAIKQDVNAMIAGQTSWSERDYEIYTRMYDGGIAYSDARFKQIIDSLEQTGQLDNTMIIVTADHGEALGEHGLLGHKVNLYDTLIHVPLLIRYPGGERGGERQSRQVQTVDILPTVLDVAGVDYPPSDYTLQGESLLADAPTRPFSIAEQAVPRFDMFEDRFPYFDPTPYARQLEAIRTDKWKFIWASDDRHELFDIEGDPGEQANLYHQRPDVARALEDQLFGFLGPSTAPVAAGRAEFSDDLTARLRDLGYIP